MNCMIMHEIERKYMINAKTCNVKRSMRFICKVLNTANGNILHNPYV